MNYNMQPQQPNLPFAPFALMVPPMNVSPGNPPVLPNIAFMPPELSSFYPLIVSSCIDAIQSQAQANPLRIFLYNQMSTNGYNNADFFAFVEAVVRLVYFQMQQRRIQDINSGIFDACKVFSEMQAALNVSKYQDLAGCIPQEMLQPVQVMINNFQILSRQMQGMGMQNQNYPPQQQAVQNYNQPMMQNNYRGGSNPSLSPLSVGGGSIFGNAGIPQQVSHNPQITTNKLSSKYDYLLKPVAGTQVVTANNQAVTVVEPNRNAAVVNTTYPKLVKVEYLNGFPTVPWKPSKTKPYCIAYDPNVDDLYYEIQEDQTTIPKCKKKENVPVDIRKHLMKPSYVETVPVAVESLDLGVRNFQFDESLDNDNLGVGKEIPTDLDVQFVKHMFYIDTSLKNRWASNEARLLLMTKKTGKVGLFRTQVTYVEPFISMTNPKMLLTDLAECVNFSKAAEIMLKAKEAAIARNDIYVDLKALTYINNRLTKRVNDFLKHEMVIVCKITSFMDDAPALFNWINNRYGDLYVSALGAGQVKIIKEAVAFMSNDSDFAKQSIDTMFAKEEFEKFDGNVFFTYFFQDYTLTSIDLFAAELRAEIPNAGVAVAVFEEKTPLLRKIIDNIFTYERAIEQKFTKHLIKTADGVILGATQAAIGEDFFLINTDSN
jgi:hypothetical protein